MTKRLFAICTLGALAGLFVIPLNPVNSMVLKLSLLACIAGAWIGLTVLTWNRKRWKFALLTLPLLATIPFLMPGRPINASALRQDYLHRMSAFEGTKYHWGGESARGIDCSGLPRRALRDALLTYGMENFNGSALRSYLEQWWFDASAKALGSAYREYTVPLGITGTIREIPYEGLLPGDLAVTTNGVHILAYAGEGRWIQADPGIGSVATLDGRTASNTWFDTPVTTHRWQVLGNDTKNSASK